MKKFGSCQRAKKPKIAFGALATKYFKIQKSSETKNVPLDEIYLECGLRFELESFVLAPEPKI